MLSQQWRTEKNTAYFGPRRRVTNLAATEATGVYYANEKSGLRSGVGEYERERESVEARVEFRYFFQKFGLIYGGGEIVNTGRGVNLLLCGFFENHFLERGREKRCIGRKQAF